MWRGRVGGWATSEVRRGGCRFLEGRMKEPLTVGGMGVNTPVPFS